MKLILGLEQHWRRPKRPVFDMDRVEIAHHRASGKAVFSGESSKNGNSTSKWIKWSRRRAENALPEGALIVQRLGCTSQLTVLQA